MLRLLKKFIILEKKLNRHNSSYRNHPEVRMSMLRNTYIDNQVHIAHNNKIGDNCIIAGQVGFAGSSLLGNNVMIGGQAGVSGHLKIGNNVHIGGGSGVIDDISDNTKVMGYPAKNLRDFIKNNR